ncbi:MAG TPA: PAS domain-containing protein, partial [Methylophilaceae bacterium]|nr:PAS domain-containing protein [Methylophilaceae bacterium]
MQPSEAELKRIFPGDSEMAQRMRAFDWSKTAAGPVATWPQSLRTAISISLRARYPMFVWWGRQRVNFYNDAYIPVLGKRHPAVLGLPGHQVWEEIWDQLGAQSEQVLNEGRAVWCDQTLLVMERNGFTEETYFTYSYSPISDDDGNTNGLLCVCSEETQRVLSQRRLQTLRALGEAATAKSPQEACAIAAGLLADYAHDLPFVLLYLRDSSGQRADLAGTSGLVSGAEAAPAVIELGPHHASWPLDRVTAA